MVQKLQLTIFPIGKIPNILKQMNPSLSPLQRILKRWCEEFDSSWNESSLSSMKPVSPDTSPGIRGTLGGGGKKREVRSSYIEWLPFSSWNQLLRNRSKWEHKFASQWIPTTLFPQIQRGKRRKIPMISDKRKRSLQKELKIDIKNRIRLLMLSRYIWIPVCKSTLSKFKIF